MWIVQLGLRSPYTFGAAKVDLAVTQMTAQAQSNIGAFPTDTQPPSITEYDSARVSILESGLESKVPAQKERFAIDLPAAGALVADGRGEIPVRAGRTVVLAMLASCCLSPTLIPAVVDRLVKPELKLNAQGAHGWSKDGRSFVCGAHDWFNRPLALIRSSYVVVRRCGQLPGAGFDRFWSFREAACCYARRASTGISPYRQSRRDGASMPGPRADPDRARRRHLWRAPTVSCIMFANNDRAG